MDNPQAFPVPNPGTIGMTLRDYFAAVALPQAMTYEIMNGSYRHFCPEAYKVIANHCYEMADAMLEARNERK